MMTRRSLLGRVVAFLSVGAAACKFPSRVPNVVTLHRASAVTITLPPARPGEMFLVRAYNTHMKGRGGAHRPKVMLASSELFDTFSAEVDASPLIRRFGPQPDNLLDHIRTDAPQLVLKDARVVRCCVPGHGWWVAFNTTGANAAGTAVEFSPHEIIRASGASLPFKEFWL